MRGHGAELRMPHSSALKRMDLDRVLGKIPFNTFHARLSFLAGIVWAADAMELVLLSFVAPTIACEWGLTAFEEAALTTAVFAGMTGGAWAFGVLADAKGRRVAYWWVVLLTLISGCLAGVAPNYATLVLLQIMLGFAIGGAHVAFTLFSEFLPGYVRAKALVGLAAYFSFGGVVEVLLSMALLQFGWRVLMIASATAMCIPLFLYHLVPESARWHMAEGDLESTLRELRGMVSVSNPIERYRMGPEAVERSNRARLQLLIRVLHEEVELTGRGRGVSDVTVDEVVVLDCDDDVDDVVVHPTSPTLQKAVKDAHEAISKALSGAPPTPSTSTDPDESDDWMLGSVGSSGGGGGGDGGGGGGDGIEMTERAMVHLDDPLPPPMSNVGIDGRREVMGNAPVVVVAYPHDAGGRQDFENDREGGGGREWDEEMDEAGAVRLLLSPVMRSTTIRLVGTWAAAAFGYYGLILAVTELFEEERAGERCNGFAGYSGRRRVRILEEESDCGNLLTPEDYTDVLLTTLAEFPGLLLVAFLIDRPRVGRKMTIAFTFALAGIALAVLVLCPGRVMETILLLLARAMLVGAFQAIFIYTPEALPTSARGTGVGVCSASARIGGMATPHVAEALMRANDSLAIFIYVTACLLAAWAAATLPFETAGKPMPERVSDLIHGEDAPAIRDFTPMDMDEARSRGDGEFARDLEGEQQSTPLHSRTNPSDKDEEEEEEGGGGGFLLAAGQSHHLYSSTLSTHDIGGSDDAKDVPTGGASSKSSYTPLSPTGTGLGDDDDVRRGASDVATNPTLSPPPGHRIVWVSPGKSRAKPQPPPPTSPTSSSSSTTPTTSSSKAVPIAVSEAHVQSHRAAAAESIIPRVTKPTPESLSAAAHAADTHAQVLAQKAADALESSDERAAVDAAAAAAALKLEATRLRLMRSHAIARSKRKE